VKGLKKGIKVKIITGRDKDKEGLIKVVNFKKKSILIENLNVYKKHVKPTKETSGGIINIEVPIHLSNVVIVKSDKQNVTKNKKKKNEKKSIITSKDK